jgi:surfeit locus 1 family protein
VLLGLGTWQLERLEWKRTLIAEREARFAAPPLEVAEAGRLDPSLAHRRVRLVGRFLHEHELFHGLRTHRGTPGLELLTPLRLAGGGAVMVNRGWIPAALKAPAGRAETLAEGTVEVAGIARPAVFEPGRFIPANEPAANQWYFYDTEAMGRATGLDLAPFVVEAVADGSGPPLPVPREARLEIADNHLQYAITWYALATVLVAIFVLYHRRP